MALKDWSTTPGSNDTVTDATYGDINWAENQAPNTLNNSSRSEMAHVRAFYENIEWRDFGHTVTRTGNTTFEISGDYSGIYVVDRRLKCTDSSTIYATVTAVDYNVTKASYTTVTVSTDSGNLSASLSAVALGLDPTNNPTNIPDSVITTEGDLLIGGTSGAETRLAKGTTDYVLVAGATRPEWASQRSLTDLIANFETPLDASAGTETDLPQTGIPAGVVWVDLIFLGVSTTGTDIIQVELGTSGGLVVSGYESGASTIGASGANSQTGTSAFLLQGSNNASSSYSGRIRLSRLTASSSTWVIDGLLSQLSNGNPCTATGHVDISGELSQLNITTTGGTDTFDAGSIGVAYGY